MTWNERIFFGSMRRKRPMNSRYGQNYQQLELRKYGSADLMTSAHNPPSSKLEVLSCIREPKCEGRRYENGSIRTGHASEF